MYGWFSLLSVDENLIIIKVTEMAESKTDQAFNDLLFTFPQKEHIKKLMRIKILVAQKLVNVHTAVCLCQNMQRPVKTKDLMLSDDVGRFVMVAEGCM